VRSFAKGTRGRTHLEAPYQLVCAQILDQRPASGGVHYVSHPHRQWELPASQDFKDSVAGATIPCDSNNNECDPQNNIEKVEEGGITNTQARSSTQAHTHMGSSTSTSTQSGQYCLVISFSQTTNRERPNCSALATAIYPMFYIKLRRSFWNSESYFSQRAGSGTIFLQFCEPLLSMTA